MVNILELVKGQLGSAAIGKVAEMLGEGSDKTSSALDAAIPSILGGIINKGSSKEGASGMLDFLTEQKLDGGMFDNLLGFLGDGSKTKSLMNIGSMALPFILGGKKAGFMNLISKATGFGSGTSGTLMSMVAPMVLGMIGKQVKKGGLNAGGLMDLLTGQKKHVANALPSGMGDLMGFASGSAPRRTVASEPVTQPASSGGGLLKWLLPLALIAAAAWYFTKDGCASSTADTATKTMEEASSGVQTTATKTMDGATGAASDLAAGTKDAATSAVNKVGDAVQGAGEAAAGAMESAGDAAAETMYKLDANNNLVDGSGNIVVKAGEYKVENGYYVDSNGKRIGKVWQKIKDAVGAAGKKTKEFFASTFGDMFAKKAGAKTDYTISKMTFDSKSQRISYYSQEEFMGLAAALKAQPDAKINVKVHTADKVDGKNSKALSSLRAEQIKNMLKTLGVNASQLSFKGMGAGDAAKAAANAIEITVK